MINWYLTLLPLGISTQDFSLRRTPCANEVRAETPKEFQSGLAAWPPEFRICRDVQSTDAVLQLKDRYRIAMIGGLNRGKRHEKEFIVSEENVKGAHSDLRAIYDGVQLHPMLTAVTDLDAADFILSVGAGAPLSPPVEEILTPGQLAKVVTVDCSDNMPLEPSRHYFKNTTRIGFGRMLGQKFDGVLSNYNFNAWGKTFFPWTYGMQKSYTKNLTLASVGKRSGRPISVGAYLRPWYLKQNSVILVRQVGVARNRVLFWLLDSRNALRGKETFALGPQTDGNFVDSSNNGATKGNLLGIMRKTYLQVVVEPALYGESYRLYEAFGSGSVILHEPLPTPVDHPFEPNVHFFSFDIRDRAGGAADLNARIRWILDHPEIAEAVAEQGWVHAQRYHSVASRVDYLIRTVATLTGKNSTAYTNTGPDLVKEYSELKLDPELAAYKKWYDQST